MVYDNNMCGSTQVENVHLYLTISIDYFYLNVCLYLTTFFITLSINNTESSKMTHYLLSLYLSMPNYIL